MTLLTVSVVLPLCTLRQIRQLEAAATGALSCLAVMAAVVVTNAVRAGFPAIKSGELPLFEMRWTPETPEAVSVFSYAFYVHPMLLPLLQELPRGRPGVDLLSRAVAVATVGVAYCVYAVIGICAAGTYGLDTPGDLMAVSLLKGWPNGALECMVALYLSVSIPALAITLRYTLASLLAGSTESGEVVPTTRRQDVMLAALTLVPSLSVALAFPGSGAEKIFSLTGATAGCLLCYIIPVVCHLRLYFFGMRRRKKQVIPKVRVPLLEDLDSGHVPWSDPLIDDWLVGKRRVGAPTGHRAHFTMEPSPFMDAPIRQPDPEANDPEQQSRSAPAHSMVPTAQPGTTATAGGAVPAAARDEDVERVSVQPTETDTHFQPPMMERRRSAPLDTLISNGSMDMRRYATFLDGAGLSLWEQVGLFVDNVALPIAVLLLGVVLSVLAVVQEVAG
ncbi:hypothetical protein CHLNCDRAFT_133361 [Chlorella variabilis]|uniref:Amino acid transporter transmembrane domain-containing protein n=1 Tax=Chlorella variabilis TaxID=554065 RepID=E1Z2X9_CHLVA|nr:hypothetical protein CHLNCDRAFT_133361 [Chlorella variabilis]EFN59745.1 hypothetical protein CHLNCDRAFT_133361 [Chlorella variabilis]|eukprot:XP_005851847.1 hypothetical protein CHLNCDRAFT_133361 [Chlorella variabilis]